MCMRQAHNQKSLATLIKPTVFLCHIFGNENILNQDSCERMQLYHLPTFSV